MFWFIYLLIFLIGLAQTPLLVDLLRLIFPRWTIKRITNRVSVYLLRVLMTTFFITGLGQHMFVFVPLMPDVSFRTVKLAAHCVFAYWVWLNMTVNYYLATFCSPGYCADLAQSEDTETIHPQPTSDAQTVKSDSSVPEDTLTLSNTHNDCQDFPTNDSTPLPDPGMTLGKRSHYCKICSKTVLYMDHHCPFTGNCVGIRNYAHFILHLVYAWIGLAYGISAALFYFGECWFPTIWAHLRLSTDLNETDVCTELLPYKEYLFPVIGGFAVLTILLTFQGFLLLSDLSTYDVLKHFWNLPIFKLGVMRMRQRKYRDKESRLNVLLLQQRPSLLSYVLPTVCNQQ